ncbi:MAG TPA: hypothetical protein VGE30_01710 [Candidatus Saccharimonadales bacterium]
MKRTARNSWTTKLGLLLALIIVVASMATVSLQAATGARLDTRSLTLSDNRVGATANYVFRFKPTTTDPIQTVLMQICANDPFAATACTAPTGLDVSAAVLEDQSGDTGFSISSQSTVNQLVLERTVAPSDAQLNTYEFSGIVNPDSEGTYYVRLQTFDNGDISGDSNGHGGIAFSINTSIDINATVPPYLLFCVGVTVQGFNCNSVSGAYVNFGEFDPRQATQGSTQMLAATNAKDGYTIRINGRTLTSGNNVIPAMAGSDVSRPGIGQFGVNLRGNSAPQGGQDVVGAGSGQPATAYNQPNFFRFNPGDVVASSSAPDDARKYTTTYVVNVSQNQPPGIYVSTITYLALGNF